MSKHAGRKSGKSFNPGKVSTVMLALAALPSLSVAAEQQEIGTEATLPTIKVRADAQKITKVQSPKYTAPLRDTPQTITVVNKKNIEEQGMLSLREVLSTIPGITFAAGEGGANFGDAINIRGFSGSDSITADGLKDSASYNRTDTFNLEQVEVSKGSNSAYNGSGSVGGSINLVSKTPKAKNSSEVSAGVGTDDYYRLTADVNRVLAEGVAGRVNVMAHRNDVAGREVEEFKRWAIAPSITFGLDTPTTATFSYVHQADFGFQRYGVPYYNGKPLPGVDRKNYYGFSNLDKQDTTTDALTGIFAHQVNDNLKLNNTTRLSRVEIDQVASPPRDNWCLANGKKPVNWSQKYDGTTLTSDTSGYVNCPKASATNPAPGFFQMAENRPGSVRKSVNTLIATDTNATWNFNTAGIEHDLVTGFLLSKEEFDLNTGRMVYKADGTLPAAPIAKPINIYNPDNHFYGPINYFASTDQHGELTTKAAYLFDTIKLNQYFQVLAGLRYDRTEGKFKNDAINPATKVVTPGDLHEANDDLVSYKLGGVFKPVENATLYVSYANSQTPSQVSVNGGCSAATCNVDPEKAETYEAGVKWDILGTKLSTTASIFRTERTNYKVTDPTSVTGFSVLDGSSRVQGLELGLAGLIMPNWSVFANATLQDSEVLQGASDSVSAKGQDWTKGDPLQFVPKVAGSLWTTYEFFDLPFYGRSVQVGYGLTYQGETTLSQHIGIVNSNNSNDIVRSTLPLVESEAYFVHNAMIRYMVDKHTTVQLNVRNLFDEEYYNNIRSHTTNATNGSWANPGEGRSAVLNVTYKF